MKTIRQKPKRGINLLSVDWDFFFPIPEFANPSIGDNGPITLADAMAYDWGRSENRSKHIDEVIWQTRASQIIGAGKPLPKVVVDARAFWSRFKLVDGATIYVSDSHRLLPMVDVYAGEGFNEVWNFDAHHDAGYHPDDTGRPITCENWAIGLARGGTHIKVRYPKWRDYAMHAEPKPRVLVNRRVDDGGPVSVRFDAIFLCRSGAWVPPWCDADFLSFLTDAPATRITWMDGDMGRRFDQDAAEKSAAAIRDLILQQPGRVTEG